MLKLPAQPGDADEDFGQRGSLALNKGEIIDFLVAQGPSTLALARYRQRYVICRFNQQGELDTSFAHSGYLDDTFDPAGHSTVSALFVDERSGVISVCGRVRLGGLWQSAIARYDADGHALVGAGGSGRTVFSFYSPETEHAGFASFLLAVTDSGQPDTSFNGSGSLELRHQGEPLQIRSLTVQADGYLITASQPRGNGVASALVGKVGLDGTLNTSFGPQGDGFCSWSPPGELCAFSSLVSASGFLIAIGTAARNGEPNIISWPLTEQGRPVTLQPQALAAHLAYPQVATAVCLPSGKLVVAGSSQYPGSFERGGLLLGLTGQGLLDPGFADDGVLLSEPYREYLALLPDSRGGVQVAGHQFDLDDFVSTPTAWRYWVAAE